MSQNHPNPDQQSDNLKLQSNPSTVNETGAYRSGSDTEPDLTADLNDFDPPVGFTLQGIVGKGGMGVVFRAKENAFDRDVALKILHGDNPDPTTMLRFVEEARITGQLQHPGIPAAYRMGFLPDGRPYLAMKLIKGHTLNALISSEGASGSRWLGIFEGICQAVGYAHAHGVIHRDLKPHNIMVGAFGEVQVMDWGLAKVMGKQSDQTSPATFISDDPVATNVRPLNENQSGTEFGSVMGTPAYMPPEQAAGDVNRIGPASDVFGLGGILCAMLTGLPPYSGSNARTTIELAIEGDLTEAFARLDSSDADHDLIALCKRCLAVNPADRPQNASVIAKEIAQLRTASDERARKAEAERGRAEVEAKELKKRRRSLLIAAGITFGVLTAGIVGTAIGFVKAEEKREEAVDARKKEKDRADSETKARRDADAATTLAENRRIETEKALATAKIEAEWAETTLNFLVNDVIRQADSYQQIDRESINPNLTIREALDQASGRIEQRTRGRGHIAPALRTPIGEAYQALGEYAKSTKQLEESLKESIKYRGENDRYTFFVKRTLATTYLCDSKYDKALPLFNEVRDHQIQHLGADDRETLLTSYLLGQCHRERGDSKQALAVLEDVAIKSAKKYGENDRLTLTIRTEIAMNHLNLGNLDNAYNMFADIVERRRKTQGDENLETLTAIAFAGWCQIVRMKYALAIPLIEEALKGRQKKLGPDHPHTLTSLDNLGNAYSHVGKLNEAIPLLEASLKGRRNKGPDNLRTFWSINNLATAYVNAGFLTKARELYLEGYERQKVLFGPDYPNAMVCLSNLADCEAKLGNHDKALTLFQQATAYWQKRFGPVHFNVFIMKGSIAECLIERGEVEAASRQLDEILGKAREKLGEASTLVNELALMKAKCEALSGKKDEAKKRLAMITPQIANSFGAKSIPEAQFSIQVANLMIDIGSMNEAEPILRESIKTLEAQKSTIWELSLARSLLGKCEFQQKRLTEAEKSLLDGYRGLSNPESRLPPRNNVELYQAASRLIELYNLLNKPDEIKKWEAERAKLPASKKIPSKM